VHDELVFEVRNERLKELATSIKKIMESVLTPEQANSVPIIAEAKSGINWGEMMPLV
jgi:DNA polymerase-1